MEYYLGLNQVCPPPGLNASAQHWLQGDREMPVTSTISVVDDSIAVLPFSKAACF